MYIVKAYDTRKQAWREIDRSNDLDKIVVTFKSVQKFPRKYGLTHQSNALWVSTTGAANA